jgi:hypothetical protein
MLHQATDSNDSRADVATLPEATFVPLVVSLIEECIDAHAEVTVHKGKKLTLFLMSERAAWSGEAASELADIIAA